MAASRLTVIKQTYETNKAIRDLWLPMYQLVGEYVLSRKQTFQTTVQPGEFLTQQLFSSVAPEAARTAASAILSNLWPNGARSVVLERPRYIPESGEVKRYYEEANENYTEILDNPRAGLATALDEFMLDQMVFGICGIERTRTGDIDLPLRFRAHNVKFLVVAENENGIVDTIYIEPDINVRQVVEKYGIKNVSQKVRELFNNGKLTDKVRVVQCIDPRREGKYGFGNKNMPVASIHFEWDTNTILQESGFKNFPVTVARLLKALGEVQGRSPAMFALPAILRLNLVWELIMLINEKRADPPLWMLDNGALGGGVVDTSPGGLSVFNTSGLGEKAPIGALFEVGDARALFEIAQQLVDDISRAFYIDKLLDFNNEVKMTLGETQIRERMRGEAMSSTFKRQEQETIDPLMQGSVDDLLESGHLGVIRGSRQEIDFLEAGIVPLYMPDSVAKAYQRGQKIFKFKYISPANRMMRTEELQGLTRGLDVAMALTKGLSPEYGDSYDPDVVMKKVRELTGSSEKIARVQSLIDQIRENRSQMAQQEMQVRMIEAASDAQMKQAQSQSMLQGAMNARPKG
jgi:hypothetical protein